jgi:replication factor C large subunit
MADSLPWTQKYRPRTTGEITGQGVPLQMLKRFVAGFGKQRKRAMLLYGPPGCGKTSSVHALANELGLELLEVNASDYRTAAEIEAKVGMASGQLSLFGTGKIILVDEIDGIAGQKDRGGVVTLAKLVAKSAFPIVITANNPFGKKFSALRKVAEMVEFQPLDYTAAEAVLEKVCRAEGITCPVDALKALALRCGGDVRGALTDLQILGIDGKITREELNDLSDRNRHIARILQWWKARLTTLRRTPSRSCCGWTKTCLQSTWSQRISAGRMTCFPRQTSFTAASGGGSTGAFWRTCTVS